MEAPNEPATFSSLPNEILQEIFSSEDVLSKVDLCSLALVNRRFSCLIPASLYRTIDCYLDEKSSHSPFQTLESRPKMGDLVRSIFLDRPRQKFYKEIYKEMKISGKQQTFHTHASRILSRLPQLEILCIGSGISLSLNDSDLLDIPMRFLRRADLSSHALTAGQIAKLMLLPNIQQISARFMPNSKDKESNKLTLRNLAGKSSLKYLNLSGFKATVPRELMAVPAALGSFSCIEDRNRNKSLISPRMVLCFLAPGHACMTLVHLSLTVLWEDRSWGSEGDGSSIDFTSFLSLKILEVDRLYCFPNDGVDTFGSRCGFYTRLPASLESLVVRRQKHDELGIVANKYSDLLPVPPCLLLSVQKV